MAGGLRTLLLLALAATLAGAVPASASVPVAGGRYVPSVGTGPEWAVELANDGGEFTRYSRIAAEVECADGTYQESIPLGDDSLTYTATPIRRDGSFRRIVPGYGRVDGHFAVGGRRVVGLIRFFKTKSCRARHQLFQGRLAGRPNAVTPGRPSGCDSLIFAHTATYDELTERGLGCTLARRIARRAAFAKGCRRLGPGVLCLARGVLCGGLRGGVLDPLASARCVSPSGRRGTVEVRHVEFCGRSPSTKWWGINLDCPTAKRFPVDDLVDTLFPEDGPDPCSQDPHTFEIVCPSLAGFTCAVEFIGTSGIEPTCTDDAEPFRAVRFYWNFPSRRARALPPRPALTGVRRPPAASAPSAHAPRR